MGRIAACGSGASRCRGWKALISSGLGKTVSEELRDGHTFVASVVSVVYFSKIAGMSSWFGTLNRVMRLMVFAMFV